MGGMRGFWVLRDLYRRVFGSQARASRAESALGSRLEDAATKAERSAVVKEALERKLALRGQLRLLKERAEETEEERRERGLREEQEMLRELRRTRERFGQQMDHIQKIRESNERMVEERARSTGRGVETKEEKLRRVFEEIEKFDRDFFTSDQPTKK